MISTYSHRRRYSYINYSYINCSINFFKIQPNYHVSFVEFTNLIWCRCRVAGWFLKILTRLNFYFKAVGWAFNKFFPHTELFEDFIWRGIESGLTTAWMRRTVAAMKVYINNTFFNKGWFTYYIVGIHGGEGLMKIWYMEWQNKQTYQNKTVVQFCVLQ